LAPRKEQILCRSKRRDAIEKDKNGYLATTIIFPFPYKILKLMFCNSDILFRPPPTSMTCHFLKTLINSDFCKIPSHFVDQCHKISSFYGIPERFEVLETETLESEV